MWLAVAVSVLAASVVRAAGCRPPEPDIEQVTAVEGSAALLPCRLDARRAATSWARLGHHRSRFLTMTVNEFAYAELERYRLERAHRPWPHWQLVIEPVGAADAGLYRCYAMYEQAGREGDDASRRLRLTVVPAGGARLAGPRHRTVAVGSQLTLSCSGEPPLSWSVDGRPVVGGGRLAVSVGPGCSTLQVDNVTADDAGVYTCRARGSGEDSVNVKVVTGKVRTSAPRGTGSAAYAANAIIVIVILVCFTTFM